MAIRIESIGTFENKDKAVQEALQLIHHAGVECLEKSSHEKSEIDYIFNLSIYREKYFSEPAFANFVQNDLQINHDSKPTEKTTFSYDVVNGGVGYLNAIQMSQAMIKAGKAKACMVVTAHTNDLPLSDGSDEEGFCYTGSAIIVDDAPEAETGFKSIFYKNFFKDLNAEKSYLLFKDTKFQIKFERAEDLKARFMHAIKIAVSEYLKRENADINDFDMVLPPQISPAFVEQLSQELEIPRKKIVDVSREDGDLFDASLPMAMKYVIEKGMNQKGKKALIINVASGIVVGCATYQF